MEIPYPDHTEQSGDIFGKPQALFFNRNKPASALGNPYFAGMLRQTTLLTISLFFLLGSCRTLKDPVFNGIEKVEVSSLGAQNSRLVVNLLYFNPNSSGGRLKEAHGDAWMDSVYLGKFTVDSTIPIPANGAFTVPVTLDVDMKRVLKNSLTILLKKDVTVRIEGTARAGKGGIYRRFALKYEGKQDVRKLLME